MQSILVRFTVLLSLGALCLTASAAEPTKITPGPKGGKLLDNPAPRGEFLLLPDRKVAISFYDQDLKAVPATTQSALVYADVKPERVKLEFELKDGVLLSKSPMPLGDGYGVVVQIKGTPESKAQTFKINFQEEVCGKCKRAEYACVCLGH
jgi:hypothetical protein